MYRTVDPPLRYLRALRRARVVRIAAIGAVAIVPSACGNDDAEVFADATIPADLPAATTATTAINAAPTPPPTGPPPTTTPPPATTGTDSTPTSRAPAPTSTAPTSAPPATTQPAATTIPASSELVVSFTYASDEFGQRQFRNPYVAVWIEDAEGALVQTIGLWYETGSRRGARWLDHLRVWFDASDGEIVNSGATRPPGEYAVFWDGTDDTGSLVSPGEYTLVVEAAREDGPYSVTSSPLTLGADGFTVTLADDVELTGLSATMTV